MFTIIWRRRMFEGIVILAICCSGTIFNTLSGLPDSSKQFEIIHLTKFTKNLAILRQACCNFWRFVIFQSSNSDNVLNMAPVWQMAKKTLFEAHHKFCNDKSWTCPDCLVSYRKVDVVKITISLVIYPEWYHFHKNGIIFIFPQ